MPIILACLLVGLAVGRYAQHQSSVFTQMRDFKITHFHHGEILIDYDGIDTWYVPIDTVSEWTYMWSADPYRDSTARKLDSTFHEWIEFQYSDIKF